MNSNISILHAAYNPPVGTPHHAPPKALINALCAWSDMRRARRIDSTQLRDLGLTQGQVDAMTYQDFLEQPRRL